MMRNSIILSALVFMVGCTKDVTVKQLPYDSKVSIQCLLTPNTYPKLFLYRTVPYFSPLVSARSLFIDSAKVVISAGATSDTLYVDSSYSYFKCQFEYYYTSTHLTLSNTLYNLRIDYSGATYKAGTTTDQYPVQIDKVDYVPVFQDVYGEHEGLVFYLTDHAGQRNYYRYMMHRMVDSSTYYKEQIPVPCLDATLRQVTELGRSVYPDDNLNGLSLNFAIEPTFKHKNGDTAYVFLQTCDKNIFDFYDQLDKQKLGQMNPFVEPTFLKPTQFTNAIGVFGSYALSDSLLFIYPE